MDTTQDNPMTADKVDVGDQEITIEFIRGEIELRSWLQAEYTAAGDLRLVGMGCSINRDEHGNIRDVKFSPTGMTVTVSVDRGERTLFDRLRKAWTRLLPDDGQGA